MNISFGSNSNPQNNLSLAYSHTFLLCNIRGSINDLKNIGFLEITVYESFKTRVFSFDLQSDIMLGRDSCFIGNFITYRLAERLMLPLKESSLDIFGIGSSNVNI